MLVDFAKGFGGEPDFDWRGYAEWLLQALNAKTGQAWILEQENLRLKEGLRPFVEWVSGGVDLADQLQPDLMSFDDDCEVDLDDLRNDGFAFLWGDFRRAVRLIQPAKEMP